MVDFDVNVYKYSDDYWRLCPYTLVPTENGMSTGTEMHYLHMEIDEQELNSLGIDLEDDEAWVSSYELSTIPNLPERIKTWMSLVRVSIDKPAQLR